MFKHGGRRMLVYQALSQGKTNKLRSYPNQKQIKK